MVESSAASISQHLADAKLVLTMPMQSGHYSLVTTAIPCEGRRLISLVTSSLHVLGTRELWKAIK